MIRYIAGRVVQSLAVILAVATLTFVLIHAAPGDPGATDADSPYASPEVLAQNRRIFGLDRPIHIQYVVYLADLARGDMGVSFSKRQPVWNLLRDTIPYTLALGLAALIIDFAAGIWLGVAQARRADQRFDRAATLLSLAVYSMPVFWLGLMLLLVFGQTLHWVPVGGLSDINARFMSPVVRALDFLRHLALPALTLGLVGAASTARYQRAAMLDALGQDFLRTARAKGLGDRAIFLGHALRNSLLPVITLLGLSLPTLLSGAVLIETVFSWPGMGRLSADAILGRDYPVVTAAAIVAATMVTFGSLLADLLYRLADPRTRAAR